MTIEFRWAEGQANRLPALAADLVRRRVAVIAALANIAAVAARAATTTIPIVFTIGGDPVKIGLVGSLNQPSGNITGVSFLSSAVMAKMLEVLHGVVPNTAVIAALVNPDNPQSEASESRCGGTVWRQLNHHRKPRHSLRPLELPPHGITLFYQNQT